jgi:hypothetical protein
MQTDAFHQALAEYPETHCICIPSSSQTLEGTAVAIRAWLCNFHVCSVVTPGSGRTDR